MESSPSNASTYRPQLHHQFSASPLTHQTMAFTPPTKNVPKPTTREIQNPSRKRPSNLSSRSGKGLQPRERESGFVNLLVPLLYLSSRRMQFQPLACPQAQPLLLYRLRPDSRPFRESPSSLLQAPHQRQYLRYLTCYRSQAYLSS